MSDQTQSKFQIRLRPALEGKQQITRAGVTVTAMQAGHVIHVLAKPGEADLTDYLLERALEKSTFAVRTVSPGQWFLVGDTDYSHSDLAVLFSKLGPKAEAVDQSHGRVRIHLQGPDVERMLAKGTAADVTIDAFPIGHATTTLFGHIGVHLSRTGTETFEILVLRGFAESLWDDLNLMSREFS